MAKPANWKSVPDTWAKSADKVVADLRAAVVRDPEKRPPALRFSWAALLWSVTNHVQGAGDPALFACLEREFPDGPARRALITTIEAQRDVDAMTAHDETWERGPWSTSAKKPWLTPFHPGIELAIYARLLRELGQDRESAAAMAEVHLKRRAAVAQFTNTRKVPYAREARAQQLGGWKKYVDSRATAIFGFAPQQAWAEAELAIAEGGSVGTSPPPT
jgi:hypothetical protein